jgi:DNA-binding helix-hairpin-helix protein with protein kinase domain
MSTILGVGDVVQLQTPKLTAKVETVLGVGGQGEVYQVQVLGPDTGGRAALKWYYPQTATREQLDILVGLVRNEAPDAHRFLWPTDLAVKQGQGFGYLMTLREPRFRGLFELMQGEVETTSRALARASFELADGFLQLHAKGFCYRDISFGNAFFDPKTGEVRICDCDNVGFNLQSDANVLGTMGFMAPEIMRGEARPSAETDRFSLAILIFHLFMVHHPFHGRKELQEPVLDEAAYVRLYANPVFIFDPSDHSNETVPGEHDVVNKFWEIYPEFLRQLFIQAFTIGRQPGERIKESVWRLAMIRLSDSILYCRKCPAENFWDETRTGTLHCWSCGRTVDSPPRLVIVRDQNRNILMLNHDTKVFPHHVNAAKKLDFSKPVAEVAKHPQNPKIWGLRNLTAGKWVATDANGTVNEVAPGRSVILAPGTRVHFGATEGIIQF